LKKPVTDSTEFQYALDACLFILIIGILLLFVAVLLLGFLIKFFYVNLNSAHLQAVFLASLFLLFGFVCRALYLGKIVALANSVLKIKMGSEDQVVGISYLVARLLGSIVRQFMKLL
jgi:hypothetical protein